MNKWVIGCAAISLLLASCATSTKVPSAAPDFTEMDSLQKYLANRAANNIGRSDDFVISVTQAAYPIGTLMRQGTTIPIDYTACAPASPPPQARTPNLFPGYSLSRSVAIDFGLDKGVIEKVVELGAKLERDETVVLSVSNPRIQTLSDADLEELANRASCKTATSTSLWLVRGYFVGKRKFTLKGEVDRTAKAKIEGVASLNVDIGSGGTTLEVADQEESEFLQIISQIRLANRTEAVELPTSPQGLGHIFIQKDSGDSSGLAERVRDALVGRQLRVASSIERIESGKMPARSQIRYFRSTDRSKAEFVAAALASELKEVQVKHIGLPAPEGQVEVWVVR